MNNTTRTIRSEEITIDIRRCAMWPVFLLRRRKNLRICLANAATSMKSPEAAALFLQQVLQSAIA